MHAFLSHLVSLYLIRILCDMLLPEGDIAHYADFGISLLLLLSMLKCIHTLLGGILP